MKPPFSYGFPLVFLWFSIALGIHSKLPVSDQSASGACGHDHDLSGMTGLRVSIPKSSVLDFKIEDIPWKISKFPKYYKLFQDLQFQNHVRELF